MLPNLNRRSFLGTSAAAIAAAAGGASPVPVAAAQEATMDENNGIYRLGIGDLKATIVTDGSFSVPPFMFAANATSQEHEAALAREFLPKLEVQVHLNMLCVDTGTHKVLIDTGNGSAAGGTTGKMMANLVSAGIDPLSIDTVVLTHMHPDHILGLRNADGTEAFPNAAIKVSEEEWAFWSDEDVSLGKMQVPEDFKASVVSTVQSFLPLIAPRLATFRLDGEILPGISSISAAGHSPGQSAILLSSGTAQLVHLADVTHNHALNIAHPGWKPAVDQDPDLAAKSRQRLLDRVSVDRVKVLGYHFPFPGLGHVLAEQEGFRWIPSGWL